MVHRYLDTFRHLAADSPPLAARTQDMVEGYQIECAGNNLMLPFLLLIWNHSLINLLGPVVGAQSNLSSSSHIAHIS